MLHNLGAPKSKAHRRAGDVFARCAAALVLLSADLSVATAQMTVPGKFAVGSMGAATYSFPIAVPPGTAGMVPALSLDYSNQAGDGILGFGWSLGGLPVIGHCPQTIAQDSFSGGIKYDVDDRFCLDGQRLIVTSGTYGANNATYRTEIDSYARITSFGTAGNGPAWFKVETKTGQKMEFGNTTDSRVLAQGKTTARTWAVNKVSDTTGNYFTATYTNDAANGQAYPSRIDYTGNTSAGLSPYNSVQFTYATRTDVTPMYQAGSMVKTTQRMTEIKTYNGTTLVAKYSLGYRQSPSTNVSLLNSVGLCAADGSCLPATTFTWTDGDYAQFAAVTSWLNSSRALNGYSLASADVNGDGLADLIAYFIGASGWYTSVALSNGDGTYTSSALWTGATTGFSGYIATFADVNGDGKADAIGYIMGSGWNVFVALSNGDGTFGTPVQWSQSGGWSGYTLTFADINGDAKVDAVIYYAGAGGTNIFVALGAGNGTFGSLIQWSQSGGWSGYSVGFSDLNGDGRADAIIYYAGAGGWNIFVALANSNGTFGSLSSWVQSGGFSGYSVTFADVNGDGKLDALAYYAGAGGWNVLAALSKGDGTFGSWVLWQAGTSGWGGYTVTFADVNGDGKADIIGYIAGSGMNIFVALSKGDATFGSLVQWSQSGGWTGYSVPFIDVNGDGKADAVVTYLSASGWSVYSALSSGTAFEQIGSVANGLAATTVTYTSMTKSSVYTKDSGAVFPLADVQSPMFVVSKVDTSNGVGGNYSTSYSYVGARADLAGRGFLGFRQMKVLDLQTNILQATNYRLDFPFLTQVASTTRTLGSLTLSSTTNTYSSVTLAGPSYQVMHTQAQVSGADLDGTALPSTTSTFQYDAYGNGTQVVVTSSDGSVKTTTNSYTNDATNWLLGRLTSSSVTSQIP